MPSFSKKITVEFEFKPPLDEIRQGVEKLRLEIAELRREMSEVEPLRKMLVHGSVEHLGPRSE
jgi:hypothetical protein